MEYLLMTIYYCSQFFDRNNRLYSANG